MASYLFVLFVLSAGFAKLLSNLLNWCCAHRLAKKIVVADKGFNLILIFSYPAILHRNVGLARFERIPIEFDWGWPTWMMIAGGAIGFILLIRSTIGYWNYRPPKCELAVQSSVVDLRKRVASPWRDELINPAGKNHRLALLPGNEQFTVEVNTNTYVLPDLPAAWEGVSIVQLSDFHFIGGIKRKFFELVCDLAAELTPDMFIFSGDLLDDPKLIEWLPETLGRLNAPLGRYFILGNHDWYYEPQATRSEFVRLGWVDLAGNVIVIPPRDPNSTASLALCGDETPWMGKHPDVATLPKDSFRVLVSHTPDNIDFARRNHMHLMLAGHTHGGQIRLPILGPVFSPSRYGCRFASGVFWLDPTLLYVTRGIAGKEPIRYNCPPEITKLILRRDTA